MNEHAAWIRRGWIVEGLVAALLILLGFTAIASTDVSAGGTHLYWIILTVIFSVSVLVADRMYAGHGLWDIRSGLPIIVHWIGVLAAIQIVYSLVATGRIANADTGLANGLVLALGAFASGAYGNWRFLVIGAALGLGTVGVAYVEEYLWVLFGIALLAILTLVLGARWRSRAPSGRPTAGT